MTDTHATPTQSALDELFMREAIAMSAQSVDDLGKKPFGAVVVCDGVIVGRGVNRSVELSDPSSHGEVEAIRDAGRKLGRVDLSDCTLYTSCEPCPMCSAVTLMANIKRVVYGATISDAMDVYAAYPKAPRAMPITTQEMRKRVAVSVAENGLDAAQVLREEAVSVMEAFAQDRSNR